VSECEYKTKQKRTLKQHKADVHDIGVTWHHCDVSECEYKTKQKRTLKQHKADVHD
jgi:glutaredoxin